MAEDNRGKSYHLNLSRLEIWLSRLLGGVYRMEWEWWSQWLMRSLLKRPQPTALRAEQGPLLGKGWSSIQMWPFQEGEPGGRVGAEWEKSHPSGLMTSRERGPVPEQEPGSGPYVVSRRCLRGNCLGFMGLVMSLWQVLPAGPDAHPWQWTDSPLTPDPPPLFLRPFPTLPQTSSTSQSQLTWRPATLGSVGLGNYCHQFPRGG